MKSDFPALLNCDHNIDKTYDVNYIYTLFECFTGTCWYLHASILPRKEKCYNNKHHARPFGLFDFGRINVITVYT